MTADQLPAEFIGAMRGWAASVSLISARSADGERHLMTATSFTSVSASPPSVLVCVNHGASLYLALRRGGAFCVNLLHEKQMRLAQLGSQTDLTEQRFAEGAWREDEQATPWLADAQANIFCTCTECLEVGSHGVFVGAVQAVRNSEQRSPLLYMDGSYRQIRPEIAG